MEKELTIDEMFHGLIAGDEYVLKSTLRENWEAFNNGTLRYFIPGTSNYIVMDLDMDGTPIFRWNHCGSSAEEATKEDLEWLLNTIFKRKPEDFVKLDIHAVTDVINEGR